MSVSQGNQSAFNVVGMTSKRPGFVGTPSSTVPSTTASRSSSRLATRSVITPASSGTPEPDSELDEDGSASIVESLEPQDRVGMKRRRVDLNEPSSGVPSKLEVCRVLPEPSTGYQPSYMYQILQGGSLGPRVDLREVAKVPSRVLSGSRDGIFDAVLSGVAQFSLQALRLDEKVATFRAKLSQTRELVAALEAESESMEDMALSLRRRADALETDIRALEARLKVDSSVEEARRK